jgi:hypothetical protein
MPTVGFDLDRTTFRDHKLRIFGLGGNRKIRGIWPQYYDEVPTPPPPRAARG